MHSGEDSSHLNGVSSISFSALLSVTIAAIILGTLITQASRIRDAIWLMRMDNAESITVPYLSVSLQNSGNESISLPLQGQCFLWPPEHSWDYECGYEFKQTDRTEINSDTISVPAKGERDFLINVTKLAPIHQTKTSLARFFTAGDWHIQFVVVTDQKGRTLFHSSRIPFTADAMSSSHKLEVYRKPNLRKAFDINRARE